ncbi:MBL fold metallo-hydrolase, partial [Methanoculleus chikugoensis]|uniref:MBL fold metallo-hydrolase n=1 Tax=Methanoculleus chikugoensis TaxID=118126 RepID=UPI001FB37676
MKADSRSTVGSAGGGGRVLEQKTKSLAARSLPAVVAVPLGATTAFIVRDRNVLLVDTGNPGGDEAAILAVMKQAGIRRDEVSLILVTHGHPENYGECRRAPGTDRRTGRRSRGRCRCRPPRGGRRP